MCFSRPLLLAVCAAFLVGCSKSDLLPIEGTIAVGGKPVDRGLVTFMPEDPKNKPTGAAILNGKFATEKMRGARPGNYQVTVNALRLTGKKIQDRMSPAPVDEMVPIKIQAGSLPTSVEITAENSQKLEFDFPAAR